MEDDPATALTIHDLMELGGYEIHRAATAGQARALLDHVRPDLIILDLVLPDADGLALCGEFKTRLKGVPVIICSANHQAREHVLRPQNGADEFVAKPFDIAELESRVAALQPDTTQAA
ncbi:MAG: response regulator transcription factor [Chloroflexi bacterium]|nr:response regulator transcription factor [Chloroflexota bacterium]